jgi:biopolymer transport protein ExbD
MKRRHTLRRPRVGIPTTSMGDVAFLLIIFFILASNLAKDAGFVLTPPRSLDVIEVEKSRITVAIDQSNQILCQGKPVGGLSGLKAVLSDLLKDAQTDTQRTVWFRCDAAAPLELFQPVLGAISEVGGIVAAIGDEGTPLPREDRKRQVGL